MGKLVIDLTPEQRAAAAERARLIKLIGEKHGLKAVQENLRRIGEKLGLDRVAETLRKAKTAPARPQEPTPQQPKRGRGGGRKRSIRQEQIERGITILQSQDKMTVEAARATLRAAGINGEDGPLYRLIIKPAYGGMSK